MNGLLLEKLSEITAEENDILSGKGVDRSLYTDERDFTVKSSKIATEERFISMRPHTRFADFPKHKHNYIEMIYGCSGKTVHTINETERIVLKKDELLLLGTHALHEVSACGKDDIAVNFIIKPEFFTSTADFVGYDNTIYDFIIRQLSDRGSVDFLKFDLSDVLPVKNLIENLLWSFMSEKGDASLRNKTTALLFMELTEKTDVFKISPSAKYEQGLALAAAQYIESSYKDAKLSDLAMKLRISEAALSKIIKKYSGETFKDSLQNKRLNVAENLIKNTDIPVTEIIISVGYENTSFFHRIFKGRNGMSPNEYRKKFSDEKKRS